jgi:histone H3/H4
MIPRTDLNKLLKKSGAPRIGGLMYEQTRYTLTKITKRVIENGARQVKYHQPIISKTNFAKFVHTYDKDSDKIHTLKIQLYVEHKMTSYLKKAYENTKKDGRKTLQPRDLKGIEI